MDLQELYQNLNDEFPKLRFHRGSLFGIDCVTSNYGRKQFIAVKISDSGEYRIDHSALYKLGTYSRVNDYESLINTIANLVKVSNPELLPDTQLSIFHYIMEN